MPADPAPPRDADVSVLVRMTSPMRDALDRARADTGLDRTNYIRQAVWRALVLDGFANQAQAPRADMVVAAVHLVRCNLDPLAEAPCENPVMGSPDPTVSYGVPYDDCHECPSCRARAALAVLEVDLLEGALGLRPVERT